jgi:2'-5' RNA ligase
MSKSIRLFFALWPNPKVRTQLMQLANGIQHDRNARLTRKSNLHVTLHFIGNTSTELLPCYIEQASTLKFQSFSFTLGQLGYFKKPKILWIGPDQAPTQLYSLHEKLGTALERCNY